MTKIAPVALLVAISISASAFATQPHRYWGAPSSTGPYYPHVFPYGQDQGTDPSELVRPDLPRDPDGQ
jgi:hypothetical protein